MPRLSAEHRPERSPDPQKHARPCRRFPLSHPAPSQCRDRSAPRRCAEASSPRQLGPLGWQSRRYRRMRRRRPSGPRWRSCGSPYGRNGGWRYSRRKGAKIVDLSAPGRRRRRPMKDQSAIPAFSGDGAGQFNRDRGFADRDPLDDASQVRHGVGGVLAVGDRAFGVSGAGAGTAIGLGVGDCDRSRQQRKATPAYGAGGGGHRCAVGADRRRAKDESGEPRRAE